MNLTLHFDKFISQHNEFIYSLAYDLNHPENPNRVTRVLRAVLHTLRERLTIQQSFHILAQLPAFLKLYYIEDWKYLEKPIKYDSIEAFSKAVEQRQYHLGERDFNWEKSTDEIISIALSSLRKYLDEGAMQNIFAELPSSLHPLFI